MLNTCEWCGAPCPSWSAMCETCAAPLGGLPDPKELGMTLQDINMDEVGRSIRLVEAVYADDPKSVLVMPPGDVNS